MRRQRAWPRHTLLLRNKRLLDGPSTAPNLLFVHGATYAANYSIMTSTAVVDGPLARAGFDVWCVDLPGYGGAERPRQGGPCGRPSAADDHRRGQGGDPARGPRLENRGVPRRHDRYSWHGDLWRLAAAHPELVDRLVLLGALWTGVAGRTVNTTGDSPPTAM